MNDLVVSTIRTTVPSLVASAGSYLALQGVGITPEALAGLTVGLTGLLTAIYYATIRFLAIQYPKLEWLLGSPKTPTYK